MEMNRSALAWLAMFVRSSRGIKLSSERVYTTRAPGSRCSMIFPSRSATSRHRSFSINPVGPIVPVSCPPWPASITILPIFKPSARVSVDCPSRVGCGALAGWIKSGFALELVALIDFDLELFAPGSELRAAAEELSTVPESLIPPPLAATPLTAPRANRKRCARDSRCARKHTARCPRDRWSPAPYRRWRLRESSAPAESPAIPAGQRTCPRSAPAHSRALLPRLAEPLLNLRPRYSSPTARRRSAATPIPPTLLALRVSLANADSVSGNLHKFFSPALHLPTDRAAASPLVRS